MATGLGFGLGLPWGAGRGGSGSLANGLVAFWDLGEASGQRNDSHTNLLHLTDNNTVTSAAGLVGTAAQFTAANTEYLSRVSESLLQTAGGPNNSFTVAGWFNYTLTALEYTLYGKGQSNS